MLRHWAPPQEAQERMRDRMVAHLEAHPDGTERDCFPAHLTAGTVVLSPAADRVLLNLHRKAGRWLAFGGHCEPGDATLAATALREAREESGLSDLVFDPEPVHLDVHVVDFCDPRGDVSHLDVRHVAVADPDAAPVTSDESLSVRWWSMDRLPPDLGGEMHELIAAARERVRHSASAPSPGGASRSAAAE